jgi:hypothetical protein
MRHGWVNGLATRGVDAGGITRGAVLASAAPGFPALVINRFFSFFDAVLVDRLGGLFMCIHGDQFPFPSGFQRCRTPRNSPMGLIP